MAVIAAEPLWQITNPTQIHWRCWDDEYVVFDERSGETHQLDLVAGQVFCCLTAGPLTQWELVQRAATELEVDPAEEVALYLSRWLKRFSELGLIEATTC